MKRTLKRTLSLLICMALVLTVLPAAVFAADSVVRVYCQAPDDWETCKVYWWGSIDGNNPVWPGVDMTLDENGIWYYDVPADASSVIFNNDEGAQSQDMILPTDDVVMYVFENRYWTTYGRVEIIQEYFVAGTEGLCSSPWDPCGADAKMEDGNGDGIYAKIFCGVPAGTYQFKITDGSWNNSWGDPNNDYSEVQFDMPYYGDVTIWFNSDTKEITVETVETDIPEPTEPWEPTEPVEPVVGEFYVAGSFNDWNCADPAYVMTDNGDGVYSLTFFLAAGEYELRVTDGTWNNSWGSPYDEIENYKFAFDSDRDITVTFDGSTVNVFGEPMPEDDAVTVYLQDNNEWQDCYVYAWNDNEACTGEWPGTGLSRSPDGWWYAQVPASAAYLIFHNGVGQQTMDLMLPVGSRIKYDLATSQWLFPDEDPTVQVQYYVAGSGELCGVEWHPSAEQNAMTDCVGDEWIISYENVPAGTHRFKITDGSWNNSWGDPDHPETNAEFTLTETGHVAISFRADVKMITVYTDYETLVFNQAVAPEDPREIVDAAYALEGGEFLPYDPTLTGVVISIDKPYDPVYENISVTMLVEGREFACVSMQGEETQLLAVEDTITVSGRLWNDFGIIGFDQGCRLVSRISGGGTVPEVPSDPLQIVDEAYMLGDGAYLPYQPTLTGEIISVNTPYHSTYGNITVTIVVEGRETMPIMCYRLSGYGVDMLAVGDTVTLCGPVKNYYGTIEFDYPELLGFEKDDQPAPLPPKDPCEIVDAAYALEPDESLPYYATLNGTVTEIVVPYDYRYLNITVNMVIDGREDKPIYCYRVKGEYAEYLKVGDVITVTGILKNFTRTYDTGETVTHIEFDRGDVVDWIPINPEGTTVTLYCQIPDSWSTGMVYWWGSSTHSNPAWPGVAMTLDENGIWYYDVPADAHGLLFNSGDGFQSPDLTVPTDHQVMYFVADNYWTVYTVVDLTDRYFVAGNGGLCGVDWVVDAEENRMEDPDGDGIYTKIFSNVPAGSYYFKVTNGTWDKTWGDDFGPYGNFVVYVYDAGNVTVNFHSETKEITVGFGTDVVGVFCRASSWDNCLVYWWGSSTHDNPDWPGVQMIKNGEWYYDVPSDAQGLIFNNGGNGTQSPVQTVPTGAAVHYEIYTDIWCTPNSSGAMSYPPYYVAGTAGLCGVEWEPDAGQNKMWQPYNRERFLIYSNVPAGEHSFRITDGSWDNSLGDPNDENGNAVFTLDTAGTVTIRFDSASKKITVVTQDAVWEYYPSEAPVTPAGTVKVYCRTDTWDPCYVYWWGGSVLSTPSWPGVIMNLETDGIWSYEIPADAYGVIFNNGESGVGVNQTEDLIVPTDKKVFYDLDSKIWLTYEIGSDYPDAPDIPIDNVPTPFRVVGSADWMGNWDAASDMGLMEETETGLYTKTFENVEPGNYEFKITGLGTWDNSWGDNSQNVYFFQSATGTVTVTFHWETKLITVYTGDSVLEFNKPYPSEELAPFRVVGNADWMGAWDPTSDMGWMEKVDVGVYEKTFVNVEPGEYEFQIVAKGLWEYRWGLDGANGANYPISLTRTASITVTFFYETGEIAVAITPKYPGDVNGDGKLNIGDVVQLYSHIRQSKLLTDELAILSADFNGDGRVNVGDTVRLYSLIRATDSLAVVDAAYRLKPGQELLRTVELTGRVVSLTNYASGRTNLLMAVEGREDSLIYCSYVRTEVTEGLDVDDLVTIRGTLRNFYGSVEFNQGCQPVSREERPTEQEMLVDEAYALEEGEQMDRQVTLWGTVIQIQRVSSGDVQVADVVLAVPGREDKPILCYHLVGDGVESLREGYSIGVAGLLHNYYGSVEFQEGCRLNTGCGG